MTAVAAAGLPTARHDLGILGGRGPLCEQLALALTRPPHRLAPTADPAAAGAAADPLADDDLQAALYALYELHHGGLDGVAGGWEVEPSLLAVRRRLEATFEGWLHEQVPLDPVAPVDVGAALWELTRQPAGPSLSRWALDHGDLGHARELAVHRSAYQLKEADPHTFAMLHVAGGALEAMTTIQFDEYGEGRDRDRHARLFADSLAGLGLDPTYGAYLPLIPAVTLATGNLFSLLSLHRRLRGAVVGHLAGFEMNSVVPMRRYSAWHGALGFGADVRRFYDVHVVADESHQHIAADELAASFALDEPQLAAWVPWGARVLSVVEARFAGRVLDAWQAGRSSLRAPLTPMR
ncbi:MAG TPA: iron-containing redox enzyme family protein [Acidimicrobiales bacterium]|nr:iron-containing redox enzyme family protein [Acidimicrobiales bacterium]